jgi:uncharacterized protein
LGIITDPWGDLVTSIRAPFDGLIIGFRKLPLVSQGDAIFHIATFEDTYGIEELLEEDFITETI